MPIDENKPEMTEKEFSDLTNSFLLPSNSNIVTSESGLPVTTEDGSALTFGEPQVSTNPIDTIKKVNESIAQKSVNLPMINVPIEPVNVVDKMQTKQSEAERLRQLLDDTRKREAIQSGAANFMSGIEKISAARAGAGLTQIKPDVKAYDRMAIEAAEDAKQRVQEGMALMSKEKEEIGKQRDLRIADTYKNLLKIRLGSKYKDINFDEMTPEDIIKSGQLISQMGKESSPEELALLLDKANFYRSRTEVIPEQMKLQKDKFEQSKGEQSELSKSQQDVMAKANAKLKTLDKLTIDSNLAGPIANRINRAFTTYGSTDADQAKFRAEAGQLMADYIKEISGVAVSDKERAFLEQNIPSANMTPEVFKSLAKQLQDKVRRDSLAMLDTYKTQGANVENTAKLFKDESPTPVENKSTNSISKKDQDAIDWAKNNPNDPRATLIKKIHNIQ